MKPPGAALPHRPTAPCPQRLGERDGEKPTAPPGFFLLPPPLLLHPQTTAALENAPTPAAPTAPLRGEGGHPPRLSPALGFGAAPLQSGCQAESQGWDPPPLLPPPMPNAVISPIPSGCCLSALQHPALPRGPLQGRDGRPAKAHPPNASARRSGLLRPGQIPLVSPPRPGGCTVCGAAAPAWCWGRCPPRRCPRGLARGSPLLTGSGIYIYIFFFLVLLICFFLFIHNYLWIFKFHSLNSQMCCCCADCWGITGSGFPFSGCRWGPWRVFSPLCRAFLLFVFQIVILKSRLLCCSKGSRLAGQWGGGTARCSPHRTGPRTTAAAGPEVGAGFPGWEKTGVWFRVFWSTVNDLLVSYSQLLE